MGPNVSGEMPSAEMWRSNQIAARAIYGHGKWSFVALIALALVLYWILVEALDRLPWSYEHPTLTNVSYFVTMAVLVIGAVLLFNRRLKAALRKRGERSTFPLTFSIEDRGLKLTTAMSESVTFWSLRAWTGPRVAMPPSTDARIVTALTSPRRGAATCGRRARWGCACRPSRRR